MQLHLDIDLALIAHFLFEFLELLLLLFCSQRVITEGQTRCEHDEIP